MKLIFLFLASVLLLSGCVSETGEVDSTPKTYSNSIYKFSLDYPSDWIVNESSSIEGITFIVTLLSPIMNNSRANVNVKTGDVTGYDMGTFITAVKQELASVLGANDYILIDEGSVNISDSPAYFLEMAYNMQGYPLRAKQINVFNGNNVYSITFTSVQSNYDTFIIDFDTISSSFKFFE